MFNLKKLLWSNVIVAFLLVGCRDSPENRDEETPVDSEDITEEIEDVEADETNEEETETDSTDTLVGAITDTELASIDDEAIYLMLGYMSDPEEDIYADHISLHKFDKANGEELWSIDFDGVRLSGNRPHHYKLTQSDDLIYLAEKESQKLVARSKEDGSEV